MARADYFLDMPSSPDELASEAPEPPSSVRPASRRLTKPQHKLPPLAAPQSSPRRAPRDQSPRKRTFQLDVGDERSPQRIRVTVEAEESLRHDAVNRTLFPPASSPTRSPHRRGTVTATTTTVPLNDDMDGDVSTPRKRGRPPRASNGTPMPRGRKRAGTPIRRKSKHARQEGDPPSEAGTLNDASADIGREGSQETPKPGPRARKTPIKLQGNTSVPSSQASNRTTGRKRGRPRKVPIPEDSGAPTPDTAASKSYAQHGRDVSMNMGRDGTTNEHVHDQDNEPSYDPQPGRSAGTVSPLRSSPPPRPTSMGRLSGSPTSSHQELVENDDYAMSEDYRGMEPQSDLQSVESEDGMAHDQQDTIADASDFSMIAVESLPSFQASFHASVHSHADQPASDQHEMGEETSRIINDTLASLRRSLQAGTEHSSHAPEAENDRTKLEERDRMQDQSIVTTDYDSTRLLSKSPRRPKQLPLSRKVFVGRGNLDDSFSTIPDSILHAATPGRLGKEPAADEDVHNAGGDGPYEDSFSEIPDAVLEAATPRPPRRVETPTRTSPVRDEELRQTTRSAARRSSPDYGSNRLPTPEATSSSNDGSGKAHEEDAGLDHRDQPDSVHRADVPSSPPAQTRPRALDFGYSNLQHELNAVQEGRSSSPQRQPKPFQTLEAPLPAPRPSLSPIVRAGRTLQNVMSDNSSPEGRERNLGSPFKGSMSSDPHQSSVARSPSPSIRSRGVLDRSQLAASSTIRSPRNYRSNLGQNPGPAPPSETGDRLGYSRVTHSRTGSLRDSIRHEPAESVASVHGSSTANPTKASSLGANGKIAWSDQSNDFQRMASQRPSFQMASADGQGFATRNTSATQPSLTDDTNLRSEQDRDRRDEHVHDMDDDLSDRFGEENMEDDGNGDDDEMDIWDIEASRTSPAKPAPTQTEERPLKSDTSSSRRSKVPSPWRRNNRRLIYKDNIASSSQIEIEESSQSEAEQYPLNGFEEQSIPSQPQHDNQKSALDLEPVRESSMQEDLYRRDNIASPDPSHDSYVEFAGLADSDEPGDQVNDNELDAPGQSHEVPAPVHTGRKGKEARKEPKALGKTTVPEASADTSEYSMVVQQAKETPKVQEKPAPSKPGFFGRLDILSFFSSPATLPRNKAPSPNSSNQTNKPAIPQPALDTRQSKEPPKAIWSTGLFPSLSRKTSQPPSEPRTDQFSPGSALRSSDTVPDTYEPSSSASPSPSRSLPESAAPSTPERQVFPPIQQKQNFTPRPGGSRGSLFAPSQKASSAARGGVRAGGPEESSDEQESSALTDGSEYERVPPREKPSQWDRNLSPTKSCFRSPLKPTTPGRIVAFSNSALSPLEQTRSRNTLQNSTSSTRNVVPQGPALRPTLEGKENQPHHHHHHHHHTYTQQNKNANDNSLDETIPNKPPAAPPDGNRQSRASSSSRPARTAASASASVSTSRPLPLSQTAWSRQHWMRLDEMLHLRQHDPLRFQQVCALPPREKRLSCSLLGKEVSAQGATMTLEPWHLEVVEAFKLEVGGWDEKTLAKRVFALVIGEEVRRAAAEAGTRVPGS